MMKNILIFSIIFTFPFVLNAQFFIDAETGAAFNTSNSVQFPNEASSESDRINVTDEFENGSTWYYRLRLGYTIAERHTISALYAPLDFSYEGQFAIPRTFGENTFL
ncbi:MAG: hypothetical protein WBG42_10190, partial [Cryomorphaceae bacterium]